MAYISLPAVGDAAWKAPVADSSSLPTSFNTAGDARVTLDSQEIYIWSGSAWVLASGGGGGGGVTSVGTYGSQTVAANGLVISGTVIYAQSADATHPGMVSMAAQSIAGVKTFTSAPKLSSLTASTALVLDGSNNIASLGYDSANTVSNLVFRDSSGNFAAGTITASLTGAASLNVLTSALGNLTDAGTDGIVVTGGTGAVKGSVSIAQHVADATHNGYLSSTDWNTFNTASGAAATSIGAFGSTPNSNGLSLTSNVLVMQPANGTNPGGVSTAAQTFAGVKTFSSAPNLSSLTQSTALILDSSKNIATSVNIPISILGITIDGGGFVPGTGVKGYLVVPYACTINSVTLEADQTGSCVVDIWKAAYVANTPPTVSNTITASALPTLSSAQSVQDTTLTGWTVAVSANDVIGFNLNSASTLTRVTLTLKVTKT